MKILFLNPCSENQGKNHLFRKFYSQVNSGVKLGDDVYYTTYDKHYLYMNHIVDGKVEQIIIGKNKYSEKNVLIMHQMMRSLRPWIKNHHVDFVYMRSIPPTYTHNKTKKMFHKNGTIVVVEIPSYPGNEIYLSPRKLYFKLVSILNRVFSDKKYTDLYAVIGEHVDIYKGKPAINIENGLDVNKVPLKKRFEYHPGEIHLLIVAVIQYWHGYDRLIRGIKNYRDRGGDRKIYLHICGNCHDGSLEQYLQYAKDNGFLDDIICHGFQSGDSLTEIFEMSDVAIGSLGLHRSNIIVDTTLKLPEYTARGIPFIYCTHSNNVDPNGGYCLRISDDESDVDIESVIRFFDSINTNTISKQMRKFAEESLQWSTQLKKIETKVKEISMLS